MHSLWYIDAVSPLLGQLGLYKKMLSESNPQTHVSTSGDPLADYNALKRRLYLTTLVIAAVSFLVVLITYPLFTALSYLLGAVGSLLYFRMLDRSVSQVGPGYTRIGGPARIGVFALVMVIAAKSGRFEILPTFLGFLTIKVAILFDTIRTLFGDV